MSGVVHTNEKFIHKYADYDIAFAIRSVAKTLIPAQPQSSWHGIFHDLSMLPGGFIYVHNISQLTRAISSIPYLNSAATFKYLGEYLSRIYFIVNPIINFMSNK